jgi:hypothetical protein
VKDEGTGITRDLRTIGALVFTTAPPPLKASIELKVFSPQIGEAAIPMRFQSEGKVRVEAVKDPEARAGFAAAAKPFALHRG